MKQQYPNAQQTDYGNNAHSNLNNSQNQIAKRDLPVSQAAKEKADAFRIYIESKIEQNTEAL